MNCARARFLIYAYLDRELSLLEAEALSRHVAACAPCAARAASARCLARLLQSRLDRTPAPPRLRARLLGGSHGLIVKPRYPIFATTAALLLLTLLPLASDVTPRDQSVATAALISPSGAAAPRLVSRQMTGIFVCLECEARSEAELCPISHAEHQTGFCAENGELWRLMAVDRDADAISTSVGRTATVEGVAFPESGFMRVSRVGY